ncbi:hypothetical protein IMZ48_17615 [Candidatus Bathyarchaeota archaeon]|nr:hypothetical protein [Candidatus Bathyarchaeota archaeon]
MASLEDDGTGQRAMDTDVEIFDQLVSAWNASLHIRDNDIGNIDAPDGKGQHLATAGTSGVVGSQPEFTMTSGALPETVEQLRSLCTPEADPITLIPRIAKEIAMLKRDHNDEIQKLKADYNVTIANLKARVKLLEKLRRASLKIKERRVPSGKTKGASPFFTKIAREMRQKGEMGDALVGQTAPGSEVLPFSTGQPCL